MIGVTIVFNDRRPVYVNIPQVPRVGERLVFNGKHYLVCAVKWYGTPETWAAELDVQHDPSSGAADLESPAPHTCGFVHTGGDCPRL